MGVVMMTHPIHALHFSPLQAQQMCRLPNDYYMYAEQGLRRVACVGVCLPYLLLP